MKVAPPPTADSSDAMPPPAKKTRVHVHFANYEYECDSSKPSAFMTDDSEQSLRSHNGEGNVNTNHVAATNDITDEPDSNDGNNEQPNDASMMMTTTMMMQSSEQEQVDKEEAWWEAVQEEIHNSNDAVCKAKLQTLRECMIRRQAALERMEGVLNQCVSIGLIQEHLGVKADDDSNTANATPQETSSSSNEGLFRLIAGFHEDMVDSMEALEKDVTSHLLQNHKRRQALLTSLDQYQTASQARYEHLMNRVVQNGVDDVDVVAAAAANEEQRDIIDNHDGIKNDVSRVMNTHPSSQGEDLKEEQEPNDEEWNEIMAQEPSDKAKHRMQVFLQGSGRWQEVQERFEATFDGVYAEMSNLLKTGVMETFDQVMQEMNEQVELQIRDVRYLVGSNFQRRVQLEEAIQHAAEQQQGMFANLMKRVTMSSSPFNWMKNKNQPSDRSSGGTTKKSSQLAKSGRSSKSATKQG